jgi:transposase
MTLEGRIKLMTRIGKYQRIMFGKEVRRGQCNLIYKNDIFYLVVIVDAPEKSEYDAVGVIGVDLGIENIVTDSDRTDI